MPSERTTESLKQTSWWVEAEMSGINEWVYEPGFSFKVTHIAGNTPVAMEVGFGLKPKGTQLMFMVKTTAPKEWVALAGDEVRLLDDILDFFETYRIYFTSSTPFPQKPDGLIVCRDTDYDTLMDTLEEYASLTAADQNEAEAVLEKSATRMTKQAHVLMQIITTFVDQADVISKVEEEHPGPYQPEGKTTDSTVERERVELAVEAILNDRQDLISELDG